jgi:hypothetical protein
VEFVWNLCGICEEFVVTCGDTQVKQVITVKYLGVVLKEVLSWDTHVKGVLGRINARLSFLYCKANCLDFHTRKILAGALVQPHFEYCCSSWFAGASGRLRDRLCAVQRKIVRFISNKPLRSHAGQQEFTSLGWLPLGSRVSYFRLLHVFKILNGMAPQYFSESLT